MTPEQKQLERDKARIRQQKRREKLKKQGPPAKSVKTSTPILKEYKTRERHQKEANVREKNRLRQQKRRAGLTPQKRRRINEKRREEYHQNKLKSGAKTTDSTKRKIKLSVLLRGIHKTLKASRTKLALFKLDFVKKILARKASEKSSLSTYYEFEPKNSFCVEAFLDKATVDFPGQRGSSNPRKVLTKPMYELYREFKVAHPSVKMSLTTFKRRRPKDILLSSSSKFNQCLCETCVNAMLLVECLNPFCLLSERDRCENEGFTLGWTNIKLKSKKISKSNQNQCQSQGLDPSPITAEIGLSVSSESESEVIHNIPMVSSNRRDFFQNLQQGFSLCTSFDELHHLVKSVYPILSNYPISEITKRTAVEVGCVDVIALNFIPPALTNKLFPVVTIADGNCVPRALSILCFGNQEHHIEVRCRLVAELVNNSLDYLCLDSDELNFLWEQSPTCSSSVKETFKLEVLDVCKTSTTMGLWQLMAAANVFGVTRTWSCACPACFEL